MTAYARVDFTARTNVDWIEQYQIATGGTPQNLTGAVLHLGVADRNGNHVLALTAGRGLEIADAAGGMITIIVPKTRMLSMLPGAYTHDLIITLGGVTSTLWVGSLTVEQGIAA